MLPLFWAFLWCWRGSVRRAHHLREHSPDATAQQYVDRGLKRALVTFATARTINAALSVAQGTSRAIEPLGVGVELSVGQEIEALTTKDGIWLDVGVLYTVGTKPAGQENRIPGPAGIGPVRSGLRAQVAMPCVLRNPRRRSNVWCATPIGTGGSRALCRRRNFREGPKNACA